MSSWQQLALEGWEKGENDSGKYFYLTPIKAGLRKRIYKSRDIPPEHSHLKEILYSPKVTTISFMACIRPLEYQLSSSSSSCCSVRQIHICLEIAP